MLRIVATWHAEIQWLSSPRLYRCREHLSQLGPGFECDIQEIPPRKFPYEPSAPYRWRRVTIWADQRSEEHTSELQSLMRISYAVFCLKKKKKKSIYTQTSLNTP